MTFNILSVAVVDFISRESSSALLLWGKRLSRYLNFAISPGYHLFWFGRVTFCFHPDHFLEVFARFHYDTSTSIRLTVVKTPTKQARVRAQEAEQINFLFFLCLKSCAHELRTRLCNHKHKQCPLSCCTVLMRLYLCSGRHHYRYSSAFIVLKTRLKWTQRVHHLEGQVTWLSIFYLRIPTLLSFKMNNKTSSEKRGRLRTLKKIRAKVRKNSHAYPP